MSILFDRRRELGSQPGVHALIVGVGKYEGQAPARLDSAVRSATAVLNWLTTNDLIAPLITCRVLLTPEDCPSQDTLPPTVDQFSRSAAEWREDASANPESIAVFYYCGFGFRRSATEDLILFSDFGRPFGPLLRGAVAVDNLFRGMAPVAKSETIARTQLYFIDTSRDDPPDAGYHTSTPTAIFDEYLPGPDDRSAVIFYSTQPGGRSWSRMGELSVFTAALLRCLDGEAAIAIGPLWGVTISSLIQGLQRTMGADELGDRQAPVVGGLIRDHVLRLLTVPPTTRVTVHIENTVAVTDLRIESANGEIVHGSSVPPGGKAEVALPSGLYVLRAEDGPRKVSTIVSMEPGTTELNLVLPL